LRRKLHIFFPKKEDACSGKINLDFLSLNKIYFMSFSDLFTPGFKQRNRDHFAAIVRVALADGIITDEEKAFLNRTAINLEIEEAEVAEIMANPDNYPINPPSNEQRRLERLYDLTRMVYADHIADEGEIQLLNRLVIGLGFATDDAQAIAEKALALVADGRDEDEFVAAF
jgi:uncharacterized tellurite resistance protein B-like protein